jgi:1,2-diacylglycerol 3-beta-galactosyltransferase
VVSSFQLVFSVRNLRVTLSLVYLLTIVIFFNFTRFHRKVDKMYVASERLKKMALRKFTPEEKIVMTGLPIRHDFAVQAENMGDRTTDEGKGYQKEVRKVLGLDPDRQMVLVMGGGEGVGSLSLIVNELYAELAQQGVDATICVVCGRNEKLKKQLEVRNWDEVDSHHEKPKKRQRILRFFQRRRSKKIDESIARVEESQNKPHEKGNVAVVGLGFVSNMAEYMAAADILVTKAGPGTIAEAAAVGLPLMLTRYVYSIFFWILSALTSAVNICLFYLLVSCLVRKPVM